MKKSFIAMGLAVAAALCFSSCKKNAIDEPVISKGVPFEISASSVFTKTTNDGLNTKWAENDALTVFHAEAGTTTYGTNDKFTVTAAEATSFTGTLTEALDNAKSYDWYAFYPYSEYIGTPKNTSSGYLNIGSSSSTTSQKQTGNGSKTHLAGKYFPLYGKVVNVAAGTTPSITMKQALAVIKVQVKNNSGENLTVTNVKFTATEDIVGAYYIDFSGDSPVFTKRGDSYVSDVVSLDVSSGEAIANTASADFYIAVKPFTAAAGSTLKIAVNGYEKSVTVPAGGVTFPSGTIKKVEFNFNQAPPQVETGKYMAFVKSGEKYYALSSTPNGTRLSAVEIAYNNETALTTTDASIIWDITNKSGLYTMKNSNKYVAWVSGNNAITQEDEYNLSIVANGNKWNVKSVDDGTRKLQYNSSSKYFAFYTSTQVGDFYLIPATHDASPTLTLKKTAISDVSAAGVTDEEETGVYTLENAVDNDVTVTKDGTVVTAASISGGVLTYTVAANTGAAREGWVELALAGQEAQTITISQEAPAAAGELKLTFDLTSNPGGWPTSNSTTSTDYTYTLNDTDYTFALKNVKCNSGYLMLTQPAALGLPKIEGKKLKKVEASNSGGCSTSTKVGISSSSSDAFYISGGEIQTWSTQSGKYTYTLTETEANTVYYLYVTNKNAQVTSLTLTYGN